MLGHVFIVSYGNENNGTVANTIKILKISPCCKTLHPHVMVN